MIAIIPVTLAGARDESKSPSTPGSDPHHVRFPLSDIFISAYEAAQTAHLGGRHLTPSKYDSIGRKWAAYASENKPPSFNEALSKRGLSASDLVCYCLSCGYGATLLTQLDEATFVALVAEIPRDPPAPSGVSAEDVPPGSPAASSSTEGTGSPGSVQESPGPDTSSAGSNQATATSSPRKFQPGCLQLL